ncbi:hypothetical protein B0H10DRAFT_1951607, partial [Mycena sp. CBHHK59/15]
CTAKWGAGAHNPAGSNAAIAFFFLFNFFFCATYLTLPALYPSECCDFDNRCASFVNTYATPIALASIQWKLYCVFIAWDVFACVVIWLCAVETAGRTLEELNEIFEDSRPVRASRKTGRQVNAALSLVPIRESPEAAT